MDILTKPAHTRTTSPGSMNMMKSAGAEDGRDALSMAERTDRLVVAYPYPAKTEEDGTNDAPVPDALHCRSRRLSPDDVAAKPVEVDGSWLTEHWTPRYRLFKRVFDLTCSVLLLAVTSPLTLLVALAIRLDSPGPVLYTQTRIGQGGRLFRIYKFRTMSRDAELHGVLFSRRDDPRITRVGRFLRRARIDELPQLWNVIRGDMSIIGPRPERPEHEKTLAAEIPGFDLRTEVKPGLTGWAQVWMPYASTVEQSTKKLEYDLYYIRHASVWLDIQIAWRTLIVVLKGGGV